MIGETLRADTEIMDLTEESKEAQEEHARLLKKVETERRARTIAVPTKAEEVSRKLRCDNKQWNFTND